MPFWKISHSAGTLTPEDKLALAKAITESYKTIGLPDFYVNVFFLPLDASNFFTAGKPESKKVSIEILHVARQWDRANAAGALRMKTNVDRIVKPYTLDRGVDLEFCIADSPAELWRMNGIDPPEGFGLEQQEQAETNSKLLEQTFSQ